MKQNRLFLASCLLLSAAALILSQENTSVIPLQPQNSGEVFHQQNHTSPRSSSLYYCRVPRQPAPQVISLR